MNATAATTQFKPRVIKRDLLGEGQELEAKIISAASQMPGLETNAILARINDGAIQHKTTSEALDIIEVAGRNPEQSPILADLLQTYGHVGDSLALEQYVNELNALFFKFKRQTQISQYSPDEFKATQCTDIANGLRFEQHFQGVVKHS